MMRSLASFAAAAALVSTAFMTGCAGADDASDADQAQTEDELRSFGMTEADNGKSFSVLEGQNVVLKLSSNPTTGYRWVVADDDDFGTAKETYKSNSHAVGSGGTQTFTWKTKDASIAMLGSHTVKLEYKRSWEARAIKTFKFTVDLNAAGVTCRTVTCRNNTHCEMKGINGGAIPVCIRN